MTQEALRAAEVRKVYRGRMGPAIEALRGVSLSLRRGERVALLGRNGAGKTTFLRIASTLLIPTSGTIHVFGLDVVDEPERVRPLIAVVPQEGKPFFHLTPREQVYAYLRARGIPRDAARTRTEEALGKMGLEEVGDRLSVTLSGGQKQRAMVATVMATESPLMFLDEPTIGLDPFARRAVWNVLRDLTRKGSTVLLTTHYLDEAEALSERLYIVEEGRILFEGTAENAKRQIGGTLRVSIENGGHQRDLFESFGHTVEEGDVLHVITGPERIHEIMDLALRNRLSATVGPVTLEEAFLTIVGRSIDAE
ncbi:MAG: ABC transporter ATP-binding protein [Methanobacteriota archaeon]|nr:MAG: ABC transporter ATP-binding protein [Euryarchaeota archaeon]